jgi:penicillin-binding protein-related factor A (putative recombinase)
MPPGGRFGRSGTSDFIILWHGHFIAVEAKAPNGKVSELQRLYLEQVKRAGGHATVAYSADDVECLFEQLRSLS